MKVTHITSSVSGGAGIAAVRLHQALLENGIESNVLCQNMSGSIPHCHKIGYTKWHKLLESKKLGLYNSKFKNKTKPFKHYFEAMSFPCSAYDISKEKVIQEADIIHLHWIGSMMNYPAFFKKIDKPIVWTLHDMNPFCGFSHYDTDWQNKDLPQEAKQLEKIIQAQKTEAYKYAKSLNIVCLCNWMRACSEASAAFASRPHHLIRNCVNTDIFKLQDKQQCRKILQLPEDKKIILFVSHSLNDKRKGLDLLLDALPEIRKKEDYQIISVGDSTGEQQEEVQCLGKISNPETLALLYNAADIFTIPSRQDNLPNTILESLACGTPVVSFPVGGIVDLIQNGYNGILATDVSSGALAEAIINCSNKLPDFDKLKIAEQTKFAFSPQKIAQDYEKLYKNLL